MWRLYSGHPGGRYGCSMSALSKEPGPCWDCPVQQMEPPREGTGFAGSYVNARLDGEEWEVGGCRPARTKSLCRVVRDLQPGMRKPEE